MHHRNENSDESNLLGMRTLFFVVKAWRYEREGQQHRAVRIVAYGGVDAALTGDGHRSRAELTAP